MDDISRLQPRPQAFRYFSKQIIFFILSTSEPLTKHLLQNKATTVALTKKKAQNAKPQKKSSLSMHCEFVCLWRARQHLVEIKEVRKQAMTSQKIKKKKICVRGRDDELESLLGVKRGLSSDIANDLLFLFT